MRCRQVGLTPSDAFPMYTLRANELKRWRLEIFGNVQVS